MTLLPFDVPEARVAEFPRNHVLYSQGAPCDDVLYLQAGGVKLSVTSPTGREAILAFLGPGAFFGEGCLAGQTVRSGSATTLRASTVVLIAKDVMRRLLHTNRVVAEQFIEHMLARVGRTEDALIDQLFNSSEKRLARTLLLLAHYGKPEQRTLPFVSQETLADMVGTTRSRVNFFLGRFERLGFITYERGKLRVNDSLLTVVLND